jgi:quercetin dioxygenase-like cupin family protein
MRLLTPLTTAAALASVALLPAWAQDDPAEGEPATDQTETAPAQAEAPASPEMVGITSQDVMPATTSNAAGDPITYPTGTAEVSSWIATVEPGGQSALHQHPVPIYVYVMDGEFEVQLEGDERIPMPEGEGILEPQNRNMQVFNTGDGPGQLLVVAMGAQGQPISGDPQ